VYPYVNLAGVYGVWIFRALCRDGNSALNAIRQENPDILISDLTMPGMSGRELLTHVRRLFPAIMVIATSGSFSGKEVPASILADALY
jgi:CheY-like chemotaxis protein